MRYHAWRELLSNRFRLPAGSPVPSAKSGPRWQAPHRSFDANALSGYPRREFGPGWTVGGEFIGRQGDWNDRIALDDMLPRGVRQPAAHVPQLNDRSLGATGVVKSESGLASPRALLPNRTMSATAPGSACATASRNAISLAAASLGRSCSIVFSCMAPSSVEYSIVVARPQSQEHLGGRLRVLIDDT